jgi:hypothetical protein
MVLRLIARMNPFNTSPLPCPTPCGAYPAGCPACEINQARQVKGDAA